VTELYKYTERTVLLRYRSENNYVGYSNVLLECYNFSQYCQQGFSMTKIHFQTCYLAKFLNPSAKLSNRLKKKKKEKTYRYIIRKLETGQVDKSIKN